MKSKSISSFANNRDASQLTGQTSPAPKRRASKAGKEQIATGKTATVTQLQGKSLPDFKILMQTEY